MKIVGIFFAMLLSWLAFYTPKPDLKAGRPQERRIIARRPTATPTPAAALPESTTTRIELSDGRKIRRAPNTNAEACGEFVVGDEVLVDSRPEQRSRSEGWVWTKVYVKPDHARLAKGKCAVPADGVFWMALDKTNLVDAVAQRRRTHPQD